MADRMRAEIRIGGKLAVGKLHELAAAIEAEGLFNPDSSTDSCDDMLRAIAEAGECFVGEDNEADWGEFSALEIKCRELGLTYVRMTDPKYEYDGEYVYYSPETGKREWQKNASGHIVFTADELEELLWANAADTQLRAGHNRLLELLDVPAEPPLEIVD